MAANIQDVFFDSSNDPIGDLVGEQQRVSGIRFWMMFLALAVGFVAGFIWNRADGSLSPQAADDQRTEKPVGKLASEAPEGTTLPNAELNPKQVVEIQMTALADYRRDRLTIHQAFAFASPANRVVTGPVERFEQIIREPVYQSMLKSNLWVAGKVVERENIATVLVTVSGSLGEVSLYRFFLSKQQKEFENCWMTDGVTCLVDRWHPSHGLPDTEQPWQQAI